jgi:hypothetical protein
MISMICSIHKEPFAVFSYLAGGEQLLLLCPQCAKIQSNASALAASITTIKNQLDDQALVDAAATKGGVK